MLSTLYTLCCLILKQSSMVSTIINIILLSLYSTSMGQMVLSSLYR